MTLTYEYVALLFANLLKEQFEYAATSLHKRNPLASEVIRMSDSDRNELHILLRKFFETGSPVQWFIGHPAKGGGVLTRADVTGEVKNGNFVITMLSPHIYYFWLPLAKVFMGDTQLFEKDISLSEIAVLKAFASLIEVDEVFIPNDPMHSRIVTISIPQNLLAPI
ncbi:hypothetical protein IT409_02975 [Candidatus Falkowbacteria bacterium]|nr:hypothetical protein [Candidatus Falkowbacteria bacterium]